MNHWAEKRRKELHGGDVNGVIKAIQKLSLSTDHEKEICEKAIGYFQKNKDRMKYDEFRRQGFFVGSGVVEAGCRTVIGQRLKYSGMHCTVKGAKTLLLYAAVSSVIAGKTSGRHGLVPDGSTNIFVVHPRNVVPFTSSYFNELTSNQRNQGGGLKRKTPIKVYFVLLMGDSANS